jgi:hypothetical protein
MRRKGGGEWERYGAAKRTDGVLGGRVDDGDATAEGGLAPSAADEEAAARDRWGRGHGCSGEVDWWWWCRTVVGVWYGGGAEQQWCAVLRWLRLLFVGLFRRSTFSGDPAISRSLSSLHDSGSRIN